MTAVMILNLLHVLTAFLLVSTWSRFRTMTAVMLPPGIRDEKARSSAGRGRVLRGSSSLLGPPWRGRPDLW